MNEKLIRWTGILLASLMLLTGCQSDTGNVSSEKLPEVTQAISGSFYQKSVEYGSGELGVFFKEDKTGESRTIVNSDSSVNMTANGTKVYYQVANIDADSGEDLLDQDVICYDAVTEKKTVLVSGKELCKALTDYQLPTRSSGYLEEFHLDGDHLYMTVSEEVDGLLYCHILNISLSGQNTVSYERELSGWLEEKVALEECTYGFVQGVFVCEDWSREPSKRYAYDLEKQEEILVKKGTVWYDYLEKLSPENQPQRDVDIEETMLEKQIKVILAQEKQWKYDYREKDDWCYEGAEHYFYMISDLDQNGRIEIFCQTYSGNGHIPVNDYFEVNEGMDGLDHITFASETEDSDNTDMGEWSAVFYDTETETYHYSLGDWERGSAVDDTETELDVTLKNGTLTADGYCSWEQRSNREKKENQKRLGWRYRFYDREGHKISARKFFALYYRGHFQSMTERTAQFQWFQTIDEEAYQEDFSEVRNVSDEELYEKMKASYQAFGFTEKRKSAAEQIRRIAACREQWMPWENNKDTDLEPEDYSFLVADLDNNGQLEVFVSFCGGSGNVSQNYYYEVNDTGDGLVDITPKVEHETDWLGGTFDYREPLMTVYEDDTGETSITHYSVADASWGGNGNGETILQDVYLLDGELHVTDYAAEVEKRGVSTYYRIEAGRREKITQREYKKLQKKHFENLGEAVYPYDNGRIFYWFQLSDKISEEKLTRKLENAFMNWMYNSDERFE